VAAQMLSGRGYARVFNLAGGIKGWGSEVAIGTHDQGLDLFVDVDSLEDVLLVGYSLEAGLRDFYLEMLSIVTHHDTGKIFEFLAAVELKHQEKLFAMYCSLIGKDLPREDFAKRVFEGVGEGGLTTAEYIKFFGGVGSDPADAVALAMSIEAQALDLYHRAARLTENVQLEEFFVTIVQEEKAHLDMLGELMDSI